MTEPERQKQPDPRCVWDEEAGIWRWPDDRSEEQKAADELAAKAGETGEWEKHGFKRKHSARVTDR